MLFVLFAAHVVHAQAKGLCDDLKFVAKPGAGFDKQFCIAESDKYDGAAISGGAYVALKNKGTFPYNFEAGLQVAASKDKDDKESNFKVTVVIGSDLTNDATDGICLNPYIALKTPEQKLNGKTLHDAESTGRMNLFGDKGIFGGEKLCAPKGTVKWCLQDVKGKDFEFVPEALALMGASVCLSLESVQIDQTGGAFRLTMGIDLLHEAIFRAAVVKNCEKKKSLCSIWTFMQWAKDKDEATDKIIKLWVQGRDALFDEDQVEFSQTINLGTMIKKLVAKQTVSSERRRLADDDIKADGALCFGDCRNYVSGAPPVVVVSTTLAWVLATFTLYMY